METYRYSGLHDDVDDDDDDDDEYVTQNNGKYGSCPCA
jgi:hypothetical protein